MRSASALTARRSPGTPRAAGTSAETAEWGLWTGVLADGGATLATARGYAAELAANAGPNAVAMAKRQIAADLVRADPAASIAESLRLIGEATTTAEYREGVAALRERRPPRF